MGRDKKITCGKCLRVMRRDNLKRHMKQHEKEKFEKESFCGSSIGTSKSSLQESESDFSLDTTNKTYEVSTLEREEMTKRLIKGTKYHLCLDKVLQFLDQKIRLSRLLPRPVPPEGCLAREAPGASLTHLLLFQHRVPRKGGTFIAAMRNQGSWCTLE